MSGADDCPARWSRGKSPGADNNSPRPLLLLAGEIVTGGKQDRVIGMDRIVPANTGPSILACFAWSRDDGSRRARNLVPWARKWLNPACARPPWPNTTRIACGRMCDLQAKMANNLSAGEAASVSATTSYAKVFASPPIAKAVAEYGGAESEQAILRELREKDAVGVVVAVDGHVE